MAIKYFWIYIGSFFAGAFVLFASVQKFAKAFAGKADNKTVSEIIKQALNS